MSTIVIVRHGRTAANATGLLLGRLDPELDEIGRRQAATLAAAIGPVDRVVSSPLLRTRETASTFGLPVEVDERFVELDYGELDGTPIADVPGDLWASWRSDPHFAPPGGESLHALGERVGAALDDVATWDGVTVVVTHVSPIKAAITWALGVGDDVTWRLWVAPASISRIDVRPAGPVLAAFNETAHLPPAA